MTLATLDDTSLEEIDTQASYQEVVGLLEAVESFNSLLVEELSDLEVAAESRGWRTMELEQDRELSRAGLVNITRNCSLMAVASPLIRRGMQLRIGYVWGQGVQVQARAGDEDAQDVNAVVQEFWDDPLNQVAFTSSQAQEENERALGTDGNLVFAFFPHPLTGRVQIRVTPFEEIQDKISNPEDRDDVWFLYRQYSVVVREAGYAGTIRRRRETRRVLHPALGYWPAVRPKDIDGIPVHWDQPMLHVAVNKPTRHAKWGVPDVYAALPWARAYEGFLTDWARLVKALSKFAWRLTGDRASKTRRAVTSIQTAQAAAPAPTSPGRSDAGGLAAMGPGQHLEAIPKTGATIDSESGKPLAAMVAAALGVSVVSLLADPGTTGARAVAETLDKPTILEMGMRRSLWTSVIGTVLDYVVVQSIKAPRGPLKGTVIRDQTTGRETVTLSGDVEQTVDIDWPDLNELDPVQLVQAIVAADSTEALPKEQIARLLLQALRVKDVDEVLADMIDPQTGKFRTPEQDAGDAAAQKFRRGEDPADDLS